MSLYLGKEQIVNSNHTTIRGMKQLIDNGFIFIGQVFNSDFLQSVLQYDDTSDRVSFELFFERCVGITTIPLINTSKATSMVRMFQLCSNLISVPLIDTSNVSNMSNMFANCSKLSNVPQFNTSNATRMDYMFSGNASLTKVPAFDMSKVTNTDGMFQNCNLLEEIHTKNMKVSFNISSSTKFTENALVEILNNLAAVSSTKTLTMGSTNLAKLTDDEKKIATDKGWTLV